MKVIELLEIDEFANREETEKQLLRVHVARIVELVNFFNYIVDKYRLNRNRLGIDDYIRDPASSLMNAIEWTRTQKDKHPEISDFDLNKMSQKWARMIAIKKRLGHSGVKKAQWHR